MYAWSTHKFSTIKETARSFNTDKHYFLRMTWHIPIIISHSWNNVSRTDFGISPHNYCAATNHFHLKHPEFAQVFCNCRIFTRFLSSFSMILARQYCVRCFANSIQLQVIYLIENEIFDFKEIKMSVCSIDFGFAHEFCCVSIRVGLFNDSKRLAYKSMKLLIAWKRKKSKILTALTSAWDMVRWGNVVWTDN